MSGPFDIVATDIGEFRLCPRCWPIHGAFVPGVGHPGAVRRYQLAVNPAQTCGDCGKPLDPVLADFAPG